MQRHIVPFPPDEIAIKLLLSLGIGLLVGFEREWSHKDLGVRTFAITALFGMLSALIAPAFMVAALVGVIAIAVVVNIGSLMARRALETTTAGALLVTFALGVLIGQGHIFTPTASAIVMTLLLALKPQFSRFAGGLTHDEIRGAVLLGLIGFVIYPVLPDRFVDPWDLLNPREAWLTVILIAAIGFLNYVLLRLYSTRGLYYTAIFGGFVNSTAAIAQLSGPLAAAGPNGRPLMIVINLLTIASMFVRNLALLLIFSPPAGLIALVPIAIMAAITAAFVWLRRGPPVDLPQLTIGSPVSVRQVASFGAIFLAIQIMSSLGQRFFGEYSAVLVSTVGGFASSASSTAVVAGLARHGQITPMVAAVSTVLASVASTLINLPIIYRATGDRALVRSLLFATVLISIVGLLAMEILHILNFVPR
ncbi:MAG: DUF4010 domain-containing protein [Acidobacteriota bacterium]